MFSCPLLGQDGATGQGLSVRAFADVNQADENKPSQLQFCDWSRLAGQEACEMRCKSGELSALAVTGVRCEEACSHQL
jgi:hypothetical protein